MALETEIPRHQRISIPDHKVLNVGTLGNIDYANQACAELLGYVDGAAVTQLHLPELLVGHASLAPADCMAILRTAEPGIADVMMRGRLGDAGLAPAELEQFLRVATAMFLNFEDGFLQAQSGMLDQRSIAGDDEALRKHIFPHLGFRTAWTMLASGMQQEFRAHIDQLLRETPVIHSRDRIEIWKALLAESGTA